MNVLERNYLRSEIEGKKLMDLDAGELAGYYLHEYPAAAKESLLRDIDEMKISSVLGYVALELIKRIDANSGR